MTTTLPRERLRPFERAVLDLRDAGHPIEEIAVRFKRSPGFIERVIAWTELPGRNGWRPRTDLHLTPLERRVLRWRAAGATPEEIAPRFRRSPDHLRRVEGYAYLKKALQRLR